MSQLRKVANSYNFIDTEEYAIYVSSFDLESKTDMDANDILNLDSIAVKAGFSLRISATVANTLVGAGIFGTFLGLTSGVSGINIESGNIELITDGIQGLLDGMGTAFITSLCGMFFSILYTVIEKWIFQSIQTKAEEYCAKLNHDHYQTPAQITAKNLGKSTSDAIVAAIGNLSTELTATLSKTLKEGLLQTSTELFKAAHELSSTADNIHSASAQISETTAQMDLASEAFRETVSCIHSSLDNSTSHLGSVCNDFSKVAESLGKELDKTLPVIIDLVEQTSEIAQSQKTTCETMATLAVKQSECIERTISANDGLIQSVKSIDQSYLVLMSASDAVSDAIEAGIKQISESGVALQSSANVLQETVTSLHSTLDGSAKEMLAVNEAVNKTMTYLSSKIDGMLPEISDVIDRAERISNSQLEQLNAIRELSQNQATASERMISVSSNMNGVLDKMDKSALDLMGASDTIKDASNVFQGISDSMSKTAGSLKNTLDGSCSNLATVSRQLSSTFGEWNKVMDSVLPDLKKVSESSASAAKLQGESLKVIQQTITDQTNIASETSKALHNITTTLASIGDLPDQTKIIYDKVHELSLKYITDLETFTNKLLTDYSQQFTSACTSFNASSNTLDKHLQAFNTLMSSTATQMTEAVKGLDQLLIKVKSKENEKEK